MKDKHSCSAQLKSKGHVKNVSLSNEKDGLFEGYLGGFESFRLVEGVIDEIKGHNGVQRVDPVYIREVSNLE